MSIFDIFKSAPTQPAQTQAPTGTQNPGQPLPGTQSSGQTAPNGVVPAQEAKEPSPFDNFTDLWKTDPNAKAPESTAAMFAGLDPKKVMESASKVDFAKAVTPDILAKIQAGGQEAQVALLQALNTVAQNGYAQSTMATTKIVEAAVAKAEENFQARLPTMVKSFTAGENIAASNPLLTNPALAPMAELLKEQLLRKNPNASTTEIQQQVTDFFGEMGKQFAPKTENKSGNAKNETDWSTFLGG